MPENKKNKAAKTRHIKLALEYDGADFFGFQSQPDKTTVQSVLEKALAQLFRQKIKISSASSRTDAGVHAEDQIVCFKIASDLPLYRILRGLNFFLPESITVLSVEDVRADFHARYHAKSKIYDYCIWNDAARPALLRHRVYHEPVRLHLAKMKAAAKVLEGKQNFKALTSEKSIVKGRSADLIKITFVRTIKKCHIVRKGKLVTIKVQADGFLYHMVRNIAGLLVTAGKGKLSPKDIKKIIDSRDRRLAPATLPACGLTLKKVLYS